MKLLPNKYKIDTCLLSELLEFGGKALAVSAPGCVELYEDILSRVIDYLVKVLGNNNLKLQKGKHCG